MNRKLLYGVFAIIWFSSIFVIIKTIKLPQSCFAKQNKYFVGLLIMATGKYVEFVPRLIESARNYFLTDHAVTYFVFTQGALPQAPDIVKIEQGQLGWPYDTMMRFHVYHKNKDTFARMDYLFALDADMVFVASVGQEILADLVGTVQPNYLFDQKPYETNPLSTAAINRGEGKHYFAGAFYGGKREQFERLLLTIKTNIDIDLARGIIASVNDESHLNRYFVDNPPNKVLNASYCHFESWHSPYQKKIVAFDKPDHDKGNKRRMRTFDPLGYYRKMKDEQL